MHDLAKWIVSRLEETKPMDIEEAYTLLTDGMGWGTSMRLCTHTIWVSDFHVERAQEFLKHVDPYRSDFVVVAGPYDKKIWGASRTDREFIQTLDQGAKTQVIGNCVYINNSKYYIEIEEYVKDYAGKTSFKACFVNSREVWDRSEQKPLAQPTSAPVRSTQPDRDAPVTHNKGEEDMKDQLKKHAKHALKATMADQSFNTLLDIVQKKFEVSDDPKKQMVAAYLDDEYAREGIKFGVALAMMYGAETFPDHMPKSDMLYNLGCYQSQASMFNGMGAVLSALRQELVPILTEFQKELPEEVIKTFGEAEKATTFSFEEAAEKAKETA